MDLPTLFETGDAAIALRRSANTIRRYADAGELVPVALTRRGGRLFREQDVEALRQRRAEQRARRRP